HALVEPRIAPVTRQNHHGVGGSVGSRPNHDIAAAQDRVSPELEQAVRRNAGNRRIRHFPFHDRIGIEDVVGREDLDGELDLVAGSDPEVTGQWLNPGGALGPGRRESRGRWRGYQGEWGGPGLASRQNQPGKNRAERPKSHTIPRMETGQSDPGIVLPGAKSPMKWYPTTLPHGPRPGKILPDPGHRSLARIVTDQVITRSQPTGTPPDSVPACHQDA